MSILDKIKKIFCKETTKNNVNNKDLKSLEEKYIDLLRNCIGVEINGEADENNLTHFGGIPHASKDFEWPYFETDSIDEPNMVKLRPLSFLVQFDCSKFAEIDKDNLLPHTGLLSFFYSVESDRWGGEEEDAGCARVYWFENVNELVPIPYPSDLLEEYRFPSLAIKLSLSKSYPDYENLPEQYDSDEYEDFYEALHTEDIENISKLLGWADTIQSRMEPECELISKASYYGNNWNKIPKEVRDEAEHKSQDKWQLLFQLDTVKSDDFELMFDDCGRLYFWIKKEDLANRRFDRVWLILQCY